jgi:hypothetical protein
MNKQTTNNKQQTTNKKLKSFSNKERKIIYKTKHNIQKMSIQYRYIYTDEVAELLNQFAEIHRYDERKTFKSEWENWIANDDIKKQLKQEIKRLESMGMDDDIMDRMFKSARYYYRKKPLIEKRKVETKKPTQKTPYIGFTTATLQHMDEYIKKKENIQISPANLYELYCNENKDIIGAEIKAYKKKAEQKNPNQIVTADELINKFKKTFKNRYYQHLYQKI